MSSKTSLGPRPAVHLTDLVKDEQKRIFAEKMAEIAKVESDRQRATLHHIRVSAQYRGKRGYSASHFKRVAGVGSDRTYCGARSTHDDIGDSAAALQEYKDNNKWFICEQCLLALKI